MVQPVESFDENPYVAPIEAIGASASTSVYKVAIRSIPFRELREIATGPVAFLSLCLVKALRLRYEVVAGMAIADHLALVDREALPADSRAAIRAAEIACIAAGMSYQFAYRSPIIASGGPDFAVCYLADDGRSLAILLAIRTRGAMSSGAARGMIGVLTRLSDGRWLATGNGPGTLAFPPEYERRHGVEWTPSEVLGEHLRRIEAAGDSIVPFEPDGLVGLQAARERDIMQFQVDRGVFVPLTERELRGLLRRAGHEPSARLVDDPLVARLRGIEAVVVLALMVGLLFTLGSPAETRGQSIFRAVTLGLGLTLALGLALARWLVARSRPGRMDGQRLSGKNDR